MRVLLTGGRGFIGTVLGPRLRGRGNTVVPYEGDVRKIGDYVEGCDVAVHLAARTRPVSSEALVENAEADVIGARAVAEYARRVSCEVVFTSTCAVYGPSRAGDRLAEADLPAPRAISGFSKLLAEEILRSAGRQHGFGVIVLRLFNVYGAGQKSGFLVSDLVRAIQRHEVIRLRNPRAVRDFIHVDDVCEAIGLAVGISAKAVDRVINIGTGTGVSVKGVAETLARLAGRGDWFEEENGDDTSAIVADPRAALSQLQWKARTELVVGLASTLRAGL
jgi:GDP-4-dehydro-6-deoxy-D-mannose reductase